MPSPEIRRWHVYSDALYPDWVGGLQRYATELAEALTWSGADVEVRARFYTADGLKHVRDAIPGARSVQPVAVRAPWRRFGALLMLEALLRPRRRRSRPSGDVVLAHTPIIAGVAFASHRYAYRVYVFHASPSTELREHLRGRGARSIYGRLRVAALRRLERAAVRGADRVVVLSRFSEALLGNVAGAQPWGKVELIPGGTHLAATSTSPESRQRRIVVVRRLEWRTGIDLLLEALAQTDVAERGWRVDIVGEGSLRAGLQARASTLGMQSWVAFHSFVTEERKDELLRTASLFVLPTVAFEGFGLATVEALGHGLIPVVTDVGASPEIVEPIDASLVTRATALDLAATIAAWTRRAEVDPLEDLRSRCRARAAEYSWTRVLDRYLALPGDLGGA